MNKAKIIAIYAGSVALVILVLIFASNITRRNASRNSFATSEPISVETAIDLFVLGEPFTGEIEETETDIEENAYEETETDIEENISEETETDIEENVAEETQTDIAEDVAEQTETEEIAVNRPAPNGSPEPPQYDFDTMESEIKLRVECASDILIKIFDGSGNVIAYCNGEMESGFYQNDFICDMFGYDGKTMTSIYLPIYGYKAGFFITDNTKIGDTLSVEVRLLTANGETRQSEFYTSSMPNTAGEYFTLDMLNGVTEQNIKNLSNQ